MGDKDATPERSSKIATYGDTPETEASGSHPGTIMTLVRTFSSYLE